MNSFNYSIVDTTRSVPGQEGLISWWKDVRERWKKAKELKKAKKEGKSTGEWLGEQLDQTLSQDSNATEEDKQKVFGQITDALDKEMINLISEEKDNSIH